MKRRDFIRPRNSAGFSRPASATSFSWWSGAINILPLPFFLRRLRRRRKKGKSKRDRWSLAHHRLKPVADTRRLKPARGPMRREFTLEHWRDGDWHVGRLLEVPGVFSQGATLDELRESIQEAYDQMVTQERPAAPAESQRQDVGKTFFSNEQWRAGLWNWNAS